MLVEDTVRDTRHPIGISAIRALPRLPGSSLRTRLIGSIVLTTIPLVILLWISAHRQLARESVNLEQEVQRLTAFIAGDVNNLLESTRQLLLAIASMDHEESPAIVRAKLADLAAQCPDYRAFGFIALHSPFLHSDIGADAVAIDAATVERAIRTHGLVVGVSPRGKTDERGFLTVVWCPPVRGNAVARGLAYAVLDLHWFDRLLAEKRVAGEQSLFPGHMVLSILDRSGSVLTRYPDKEKWTGTTMPDTVILQAVLARGEGAADLTGVDGVTRFYAFQSVSGVAGDIVVCTGVLRDAALASARATLYWTIGAVLGVAVFLVLVAWFATGLFIARPVTALVDTTQKLAAGDLSVRAGGFAGPREIARLARAFDSMAAILQQDAAERQRMQNELVTYDRQLRSMSHETALAEEQERRRIAGGLHDKAGPLLAACYMKLGKVLKAPDATETPATLEECRDFIDQAVRELRSLTFELCSPALYTLGLAPAVSELCRTTAERHNLEIIFRDQEAPADLPTDARVILYRAVCELLHNVVKHAEAPRVIVTCGGDAEEVFILVEDHGLGFDAPDVGRGFTRNGGFGLFNLRERVTHLGGVFTVASSRGTGTRVRVSLPVRQTETRLEDEHVDPNSAGG